MIRGIFDFGRKFENSLEATKIIAARFQIFKRSEKMPGIFIRQKFDRIYNITADDVGTGKNVNKVSKKTWRQDLNRKRGRA